VCCDDAAYEFIMDHAGTSRYIGRGNSGRVAVIGGCPPFTWASDNADFDLRNSVTQSRYNFVTVDEDADEFDTAIITVLDNCSNYAERETVATGPDGEVDVEAGEIVAYDDDDWNCYNYDYNFYFLDESPDNVDEDGEIEIEVVGGRPPYYWISADPTILSFTDGDNTDAFKMTVGTNGGDTVTLYAEGCGAVAITMSDGCMRIPIHPTGVGTVNAFVECCCEQDPDTFELDTVNTPSQVSAGSSITVYVLGGCPPFTWGQGAGTWGATRYHWAEETTTARQNVLYASGTCGNMGAYCDFNITDYCETVCDPAGISILLTEGQWGSWTTICTADGCQPPQCCDPGFASFSGDYKYRAGDWQGGQSAAQCAIDCCSEAIASVMNSCWFECNVIDPGPPLYNCYECDGGGCDDIKTLKAGRAKWECP
jgi:hypothetical protein